MSLADLPGEFITFTRDEIVERYKRDVRLRNPEADVVSGQPDLDAKNTADVVLPVYTDARLIADGINEDAATGPRLDLVGNRIDVPRGAATGASGYVSVETSAGGGTVQEFDELENPQTKKRYEAAQTRAVITNDHVRVRAKSKGPETDVAAGTVLRWTSPRPGIFTNATVVEQTGGRGLTGGAEAQGDPRYLDSIRERKRNPIGGDNDAEVVAVIRKTPDVPIEQVFTYPAAEGPGTNAFTFTLLTPTLGASRLPTDAQVTAALEWLNAQMPGDHNYFPTTPISVALVLAFQIAWATGGWAQSTPWPEAYGDNVVVSSAASATSFVLSGSGDSPVVGQIVAFWDRTHRTFQRKQFATVSGVGPWTITCATDNAASDTTYIPQVGQRASPWSDKLAAVSKPILSYMATLGPSELFAPDDIPNEEGRRRIREPRAPKEWPFATTNKVTVGLTDLPEVSDALALAGVGSSVSPGYPPHMYELSDVAIYAL